ncbi:MAG: Na/Pi cotransporter family protein [Myxococcales bacterium]|nr:Na/Pi cotransporter family protein [Myxococcales bacterium]
MSAGDVFYLVATFAGGLGFFLLGMHLLTEGLKVAAGGALERILRRSTKTRARALVAGAGMTALVQSSSAVTVATLGFVNAGLLELRSAVWVVFGSNVGTTATGWLVSLTGIGIDLKAAALPIVGVGTVLQLSGSSKRRGAFGRALTGLGLFFVGVGVLQDAFGSLSAQIDLRVLHTEGALGVLVLVVVGALMTTVMQSSSAAIAVTLTAAHSGALQLTGAAAMVVGANIGTTSTALLAAAKATPDAKRAAFAHTAFNLLTGVVALLSLPVLLRLVDVIDGVEEGGLTRTLALFHTVFNLLGVVLMWPITDRLVRWLDAHFERPDDDPEARPRHLDPTIFGVPHVALSALALETERLAGLAARVTRAAFEGNVEAREADDRSYARLLQAIVDAVDRLAGQPLPPEIASGTRRILRVCRHLTISTEQAAIVAEGVPTGEVRDSAFELLDALGESSADPDRAAELFGAFEARLEDRVDALLHSVGRGGVAARAAMREQRLLSEARRALKHLARAHRELAPLRPAPPEES